MTKFFGRISIALAAISTSHILSATTPGPIPNNIINRAIQWMQDDDADKRGAAYRTFHLYSDPGAATLRKALLKTKSLHEQKLNRTLNSKTTNPFIELPELASQLESERTRIYELILTDYKKDPNEVRKLHDEIDSLSRLNEKIRRLVNRKDQTLTTTANTIGGGLAEIDHLLNLIDKNQSDRKSPDEALSDTLEGDDLLLTIKLIEKFQNEISLLEKTNEDNKSTPWASTSQHAFANHLNEFRSLFGLTPFALEERLSQASIGHTNDMIKLGFFAHESPIKEKKSPADRARLAEFQHQWTGENIYMGSPVHTDAYLAWFASDGHRFIMFANGPNLIGLGPVDRHWTLMTGRK